LSEAQHAALRAGGYRGLFPWWRRPGTPVVHCCRSLLGMPEAGFDVDRQAPRRFFGLRCRFEHHRQLQLGPRFLFFGNTANW